jgi:hypothetical protein
MRVLFDQGTPVPLAQFLVGHRLATEGSMEISLVMGKQRGKQAELHYGADEPSCIFWYYYK